MSEYRPTTTPIGDIHLSLDEWAAPAVDEYGTEWIPTSVEGWNGGVEVRSAGEARPRDHGDFDGAHFYGPRLITIEGTAVSPTREANMMAQDIIASVASGTSGLHALRVTEPGRPVRRCMVRLNDATKVATSYGGYAFDFNLSLKAPDPRRYADDETPVDLVLPPSGGSGLTGPITGPITSPAAATAAWQAAVTNAGTIATRPVVTFTGPLVDPGISNVTTGRSLAFTITLAAGQTLVVDMGQRTALLDGLVSRAYLITPSSAWWDLPPGISDVVFTGGDGAGTAHLTFRSAWL